MTIVAVSNQKGGVGKTTIAFNLAKGLAVRGRRVLVIDNDPQGNLTHALLAEPEALTAEILSYYKPDAVNAIPQPVARNLFLLGANQRLATVTDLQIDDAIFGLKEGLEQLRGDFDYILIDYLPSFGVLQLAALTAADEVLIPVTPANFSVQGLTSLFETIARAQKRFNEKLSILGIILNRVEGRHTTIGDGLVELLRETYTDLVFTAAIHQSVRVEESYSFNQSVLEYEPKGKVADQINCFIDEFLQRHV
jgi:chromosome partitioning protein